MHAQIMELLENHVYEYKSSPALEQESTTVVEICNPYQEHNITLRKDARGYSVHFAGWMNFYSDDPASISALCADLENLMNNDAYIWQVMAGNAQMFGYVHDASSQFASLMEHSYPLLQAISAVSGLDPDCLEQSFVFWNPAETNPNPSLWLN